MQTSIVIPTYNHTGFLKSCVQSVLAATDLDKRDCEIVVVANGCKDGSEDYVRSLGSPRIRVLSDPEPLGFTKAVNWGIGESRGEFVVLLNDDVQILDWGRDDAWLKMLESPFSDPRMGLTGSNKDYWGGGKWFLVFFCTMIRRKVFDEIGILDEAFNPGAGEDCDFSIKAQMAGWKMKQVPFEDDRKWGTAMPIWHIGHGTLAGMVGFDEIAARNTAELERRYPRTEKDRKFQADFSRGTLNGAFHPV
jgi:GT2 family glycosyltransferase